MSKKKPTDKQRLDFLTKKNLDVCHWNTRHSEGHPSWIVTYTVSETGADPDYYAGSGESPRAAIDKAMAKAKS